MTREDHKFEVKNNAAKFMTKIFHATLSYTINPGQQILAATNFYTNVANHIVTYGMSIVPFAELSSSTGDYFVPSTEAQYLGVQAMDLERENIKLLLDWKLSLTLNAQLQDTINQLFVGNRQDGFNMLKTLMEIHILKIRKPNTPGVYVKQTARPIFKIKSNPYAFQSDLNLYYQNEASHGRTYLDMEKTNVFLGDIESDTKYTKETLDIWNVLPRDINMTAPHKYRLGHIS